MKNNSIKEIGVALILIVLAIFLLNPMHFYMPTMVVMSCLALALVSFGLFSTFVLREEDGDEREMSHRTRAGRVAFLVGSGVSILGIVVESFSHSVDPWLVITLATMIIAKIASRMWSDKNL